MLDEGLLCAQKLSFGHACLPARGKSVLQLFVGSVEWATEVDDPWSVDLLFLALMNVAARILLDTRESVREDIAHLDELKEADLELREEVDFIATNIIVC